MFVSAHMEGMTTFDEAAHPRGAAGKFTTKAQSEAAVSLGSRTAPTEAELIYASIGIRSANGRRQALEQAMRQANLDHGQDCATLLARAVRHEYPQARETHLYGANEVAGTAPESVEGLAVQGDDLLVDPIAKKSPFGGGVYAKELDYRELLEGLSAPGIADSLGEHGRWDEDHDGFVVDIGSLADRPLSEERFAAATSEDADRQVRDAAYTAAVTPAELIREGGYDYDRRATESAVAVIRDHYGAAGARKVEIRFNDDGDAGSMEYLGATNHEGEYIVEEELALPTERRDPCYAVQENWLQEMTGVSSRGDQGTVYAIYIDPHDPEQNEG